MMNIPTFRLGAFGAGGGSGADFAGLAVPPETIKLGYFNGPAGQTTVLPIDLSSVTDQGGLSQLRSLYIEPLQAAGCYMVFAFSTGQRIAITRTGTEYAQFINVLQISPVRFVVTIVNGAATDATLGLSLNNFFTDQRINI
jgi:hypothetical protein